MDLGDYRSFLMRAFTRRQNKNPSYTYNAYARDLQMSPQKLNQILKGRTGLSKKAASKLTEFIEVSDLEARLFVSLVEASHSRSPDLREKATDEASKLLKQLEFSSVDPETFRTISQWYHWALYLLVDLEDFESSPEWIARRLRITTEQAQAASTELFGAGLLMQDNDGRWRRKSSKFAFSPTISTKDIRGLYRQLFDKAIFSIENEMPAARHYHVGVLNLSAEEKMQVQVKVDDFVKDLLEQFPSMKQTQRVYCLGISLFPLDNVNEEATS